VLPRTTYLYNTSSDTTKRLKGEQACFIDADYLFPFPINIKENDGSTYRP